jgi:exodeoxyribonuclease V alpha subunit
VNIEERFAKYCLRLAKIEDEDFFAFCIYIMQSVKEGHTACKIEKNLLLPPVEDPLLMEKIYRGSLKNYPNVISDVINGEFSTLIGRMGSIFYVKRSFDQESKIVDYLEKKITEKSTPWTIEESLIPLVNKEQHSAINAAANHPLLIISGGPGRGKSFIAAQILKQFFHHKPLGSVILSAPTGKAVSHLESKIEYKVTAKTLHRLLGIREEAPTSISQEVICADLLIIDECSMIDLHLWSLLTSALSPQTRVILIGDPHQLPPIETGTFFRDLCELDFIPHIHLTECLRSECSYILGLADAVFREDQTKLEKYITPLPNFEELIKLAAEKFPNPSDTRPEESELARFAILSSLKKGPFGSNAINEGIEELYYSMGKTWMPIPILITKNSYSLELYNGEIGVLFKHRYDPTENIAYFKGKSYPSTILPPFEKAWAISVHKSQGSEYDDVFFILAEGSETFGKEMLYTGITRAKNVITIFSRKETFFYCLSQKTKKYSFLKERIKTPAPISNQD